MSEPEIPLSEPFLGGNERKYLDECLETNFVSSVGPFVDRFERAFAEYVGARHAVACASGTAALHVAMRLAGVGPGDQVLVPSLTFIASANPILYEHAQPILVDSEPRTWNLDPERVADELHRRARAGVKQPKVVEAVHLLGHPCELEPIAAACEQYGVTLIEDAAESIGARYTQGRFAGRHAGTLGRIGCFSFNGNKILTAGGGGMIVTDDEALARRAKHLTTQARLPGLEYRHDEVGYNYRLTNLAAALGLAQLEQVESFVLKKHEMARRYDEALGSLAGLTLPPRAPWASSTTWLYTVLVDAKRDRAKVIDGLRIHGVQARPIWTPLHGMPMFAGAPHLGTAVADDIFARAISLPSSVSITPEQQARVVRALHSQYDGK